MIHTTMKSRGAVDRNSLSSINSIKSQGALTAGSISALNQSAVPGLPLAGVSAAQRNQSAGHTNTPVRTGAAGQTNAPVRTHGAAHTNNTGRTTGTAHVPAGMHRPNAPTRTDVPAQAAVPAKPPVPKPLPTFAKVLQKGQKVPLETAAPLTTIRACFGWNTANPQCDIDVSAFLLNADGKVLGDSWFVFYGQTKSPDKSCRLELENGMTAERQSILIDFSKLNANIKKIVFVLTIHDAFAKRLHFGMVQDAYVRILHTGQTELASFQMTDHYTNVISMMIGEIYKHNGKWKFNAIGNGVAKDLAGLCALYGVQVSD